jgi:hypothetical protein
MSETFSLYASIKPFFAADVPIPPMPQVLGVGTEYIDYSSKTDAYWQYLHNSTGPHTRRPPVSSNTSSHSQCAVNGLCVVEGADADLREQLSPEIPVPVPDEDIVLFMDAYDVLVFPALADAAKVLAGSPSPLLFCAERGVYPEFAGMRVISQRMLLLHPTFGIPTVRTVCGAAPEGTSFSLFYGYIHIFVSAGTYFYPRGTRDGRHLSGQDAAAGDGEDSGVGAEGGPSSHSSSAASQKFLNSGCVLGECVP